MLSLIESNQQVNFFLLPTKPMRIYILLRLINIKYWRWICNQDRRGNWPYFFFAISINILWWRISTLKWYVLYKFLSPKEEVIFETCKLVVGISVSDIKMAPIDDQWKFFHPEKWPSHHLVVTLKGEKKKKKTVPTIAGVAFSHVDNIQMHVSDMHT